ncbi:hypothetical protein Tco_0216689 [Tanacetum coccineum]
MKDRLFVDTSISQRCKVLYKVVDIATRLVKVYTVWDDWEVDHYRNVNLVIMEYLVKISKKARILELKRRHLKITILTSTTLHPSRKIGSIGAWTTQTLPCNLHRRRGKVYKWKTTKYGKIWYDDDIHDLRSVGTEFPAVVFNEKLTSEKALSCEPTVSPLNDNEIDFKILFDESDDEDYTVIFDKKPFSYQIISIDNLKTVLENDNDKVNRPSFPSPKPTVSYFDDLDFLKDFENEFSTIVYNDALTSKSCSSTEPIEIPHRINEFDLTDETSLSKYDEEEQNILYFNDLFPFNRIYLYDLKSDKDNDDNKIDII